MPMQSLKKIGQLTKVGARKRSADGQTDGWTLKRFGEYKIIPRHVLCGGV